jgi:hypothetical protein
MKPRLLLPTTIWVVVAGLLECTATTARDGSGGVSLTGKDGRTTAWWWGWSVNPKRLVSPILNSAKTVAPASVRHDIDLLKGLFDVKEAKWAIFQQRVALGHCVLRLQDQPSPALTIGRLDVHWDSLMTPTVDIEIEDVLINIEFTNALLSRHNWNEINEGIAPLVTSYQSTSRWFGWDKPVEEGEEEFLQFNRITMLGNLTLGLRIRPLKKDLAKLSLKMSIGDLTDKIEKLAETNFKRHGRRGCSTTELTALLRRYFTTRLQDLLKEIARDPQKLIERKDHYVKKAQALISRCKAEVSVHAGERIRTALDRQIDKAFARVNAMMNAFFDRLEKGLVRLFDTINFKLFGHGRSSAESTRRH